MRVSSAEFLRDYTGLSQAARREPVTITSEGHDPLVLMSMEEFERVRRYLPRSRLSIDLSDDELDLISHSKVPPGYEHLDALLDDD